MKILITYFLLIYIFFSSLSFSKNKEFLNIKDIFKEHYISIFQVGKSNQEFEIKEMIKSVSKKTFGINKDDVEKIEILAKTDINLKAKEWVIEKIYFIQETIGNDRYEIISPEPKLPRDYYKNSVKFEDNEYNKIIFLKLKHFNLEIPRFAYQFYKLFTSEISFDIELFLFVDEKNDTNIKEKKFQSIYYNVIFLYDTSPLNTLERQIKVYGVLKGIE